MCFDKYLDMKNWKYIYLGNTTAQVVPKAVSFLTFLDQTQTDTHE